MARRSRVAEAQRRARRSMRSTVVAVCPDRERWTISSATPGEATFMITCVLADDRVP